MLALTRAGSAEGAPKPSGVCAREWIEETAKGPDSIADGIHGALPRLPVTVEQLYCGDSAKAPEAVQPAPEATEPGNPCSGAQLEIHRDGSLVWRPERENGTWCLHDEKFSNPTRVLLNPTGATTPVGVCGPVQPDTVYAPFAAWAQQDTMSLVVWDISKEPFNRAKPSAEMQAATQRVLADYELVAPAARIEAWLAEPNSRTKMEALLTAAEALKHGASSAAQAAFEAARAAVLQQIAAHLAKELESTGTQELDDREAAARKLARDTILDLVPRSPTDVGKSNADYAKYLDERFRVAGTFLISPALDQFIADRMPTQAALLSNVALLALAAADPANAAQQLLGRARVRLVLPVAERFDRVIALKPGSGRDVDEDLYERQRVALFAHDLPSTSYTAAIPDGKDLPAEANKTVAALAKIVTFTATTVAGGARVEALVLPPCNQPLTGETFDSEALSGVVNGPAISPLSTQVTIKRLEARKEYRALLCSQGECTADAKSEHIAASRTFETRAQHHSLSLGAELAYNVASGRPSGGYHFAKVGGAGGPDQLYRLEGRNDAADSFTISALLTFYPASFARHSRFLDGFAIAAGPSLFRGGDAEFLKQWNLRAGFDFWGDGGLLLTFGYSYRRMPVPKDVELDTIVSVPRSSNEPPSFDTEEVPVHYFSIGVMFDTQILTKEGEKLLGGGEEEE